MPRLSSKNKNKKSRNCSTPRKQKKPKSVKGKGKHSKVSVGSSKKEVLNHNQTIMDLIQTQILKVNIIQFQENP